MLETKFCCPRVGNRVTKRIQVTRARQYVEFRCPDNSVISISFPENCVLAPRKVNIEVHHLMKSKKLNGEKRLITPIVFITVEKPSLFLRKVCVKLPLLEDVPTEPLCEKSFEKHFRITQRNAYIYAFSFSPVALTKSVSIFVDTFLQAPQSLQTVFCSQYSADLNYPCKMTES